MPFVVPGDQAGLRLDRFLATRLRRSSRSELRRLIDAGRVRLPGRRAKPAARVLAGETVLVVYPRRPEPPPASAPLPVVFEDERLLAVNKPAGMLSHPAGAALRNAVTSVLRERRPELRLHLLHRLDRETSGLLLLGKDPATARAFYDIFRGRALTKEYLALAAGRVAWASRTVDRALGSEGGEIFVRQAVSASGGQPAVTRFRRLAAGARASLLLARPQTGRLHQIRVHLAALGHPVLGDKLYSGNGEIYLKAVARRVTPADLEALGAPRQMLHAWRVRFRDPATGRRRDLVAPPPEDFAESARSLGLALPG